MLLAGSVQQVQNLVMSFHPVIVMETVEEERVQTLLQIATHDMQMPLFEWSVTQGLIRSPASYQSRWTNEFAPPGSVKPTAFEDTAEPLKALKYIQEMTQKAVFLLKDFAKHLDDPIVVRQFRDVAQDFSHSRSTLVLSGDDIQLAPELAHDAVFFDIKLPGKDELQQVVIDVIRTLKSRGRVQIELQDTEIPLLVQALNGMTLKQARQVLAYAAMEDDKLSVQDVARILHRKAQVIREGSLLEYFPIGENSVSLGGFTGLKQWLKQARVGFSPQAQSYNLTPPKGILILGIQGCGKSLAAKAIAHAWKMPLLKLDAGRLYDKYVGESEKNFRQAITLAESMAPTVLWIDEIEKSLGNSSGSDADGGLSRRLFGSFLTWMQEKSQEVFVVATANDISQLPPELLRKGRFDEIFYVDLPDAQERNTIWQIHLVRRRQNLAQLDLAAVVAASEGFSGAEIEQATITALYRALYDNKPLDTSFLLAAIRSTIPLSVSRREDLELLRAIAKDRFVNAR
jgi:hypothetical protein